MISCNRVALACLLALQLDAALSVSLIRAPKSDPVLRRAKESSQRAWEFFNQLKGAGCDTTCASSPYQLYLKNSQELEEEGEVCLTIAALGCYQSKSPCCAALAARFARITLSVGKKMGRDHTEPRKSALDLILLEEQGIAGVHIIKYAG